MTVEMEKCPTYLPAENALVPKTCRFCHALMEIKQINLTVAVRQCYNCSTPLQHLDFTDIEFFHRSYRDKDKSPSDWSSLENSEEEELNHLTSWIEKLNITITKYEESSDDDITASSSKNLKECPLSQLLIKSDCMNFDDFVGTFHDGTNSTHQEVQSEWVNGELDELDALLESVSSRKPENGGELPFSPHDLLFSQAQAPHSADDYKGSNSNFSGTVTNDDSSGCFEAFDKPLEIVSAEGHSTSETVESVSAEWLSTSETVESASAEGHITSETVKSVSAKGLSTSETDTCHSKKCDDNVVDMPPLSGDCVVSSEFRKFDAKLVTGGNLESEPELSNGFDNAYEMEQSKNYEIRDAVSLIIENKKDEQVVNMPPKSVGLGDAFEMLDIRMNESEDTRSVASENEGTSLVSSGLEENTMGITIDKRKENESVPVVDPIQSKNYEIRDEVSLIIENKKDEQVVNMPPKSVGLEDAFEMLDIRMNESEDTRSVASENEGTSLVSSGLEENTMGITIDKHKENESIPVVDPIQNRGTLITYSPGSINSPHRQKTKELSYLLPVCKSETYSDQEDNYIGLKPNCSPPDSPNSIENPNPSWSTETTLQLSSLNVSSPSKTLLESDQSQTKFLVVCDCKDEHLQLPPLSQNQCIDVKLPDLSLSCLRSETIVEDLEEEIYTFPSDLDKVMFSRFSHHPRVDKTCSSKEVSETINTKSELMLEESVSEEMSTSVMSLPSMFDLSTGSILVTIPADIDITSEMLGSASLGDVPVYLEGPDGVFVQAPVEKTQGDCENSDLHFNVMSTDIPASSFHLQQSDDVYLQPAQIDINQGPEYISVESDSITDPYADQWETNCSFHLPQTINTNESSANENEFADELNKISNFCVDQPLRMKGVVVDEDDEELKAFTGAKFKPMPNRKLPLKEGGIETGPRYINLLHAMQREIATATPEKKERAKKVNKGNAAHASDNFCPDT